MVTDPFTQLAGISCAFILSPRRRLLSGSAEFCMNEMALELLTAPRILKRILQRDPSPLMPARVVFRVPTLNVPWVPGGIKPQNFKSITVPLSSPAETLSTVITFGSYFISNEEDAKLLIWETLTETLKYLAL